MPVNNNYEIQEYCGNSSGRIFNFPFRCFSLDHLVVELLGTDGVVTTLLRDTDYAVTGGLDNSGGMVTYPLESRLPALGPTERLRIYRSTPLEQPIDYPSYQQAIENALDKTTMLLQEAVSDSAVALARAAEEKVDSVISATLIKADLDGGNIDKFAFLSNLGIGSDGELNLSDLTCTDASNADAEAFRILVGMPEAESATAATLLRLESIASELQEVAALSKHKTAIRAQTIVAGATGDRPEGWDDDWCDAPAAHIYSSGTHELTLVAGLQVAAGYEGQVYVSQALAEDTTLDISDLVNASSGTAWIYSDVGTDGSISFGYTRYKPQIGMQNNPYYDFVPKLSANTDQGYNVSQTTVYSGYYAYQGYDDTMNGSNGAITASGTYPSLIGDESYYIRREDNMSITTNGIVIYPYVTGSTLCGQPIDFTIDGSNDSGDSWVNLVSVTGEDRWEVETEHTGKGILYTWNDCDYPLLRIHVTLIGSKTYCGLGELKWLRPSPSDFYNIATQSHYDKSGNAIRRVYIGSVYVLGGIIENVINYQQGTVHTSPINNGNTVGLTTVISQSSAFLGYCSLQLRMWQPNLSMWGDTFWSENFGQGARAYSTEGVVRMLTGTNSLDVYRSTVQGSEFGTTANQTTVTSTIFKVTETRAF